MISKVISETDKKISPSDPVNKAMSFPELSQRLIAWQNKLFKTFCPLTLLNA